MSEDSSAEAPTPKKSPSRKRSSGPRKKARRKPDETPENAGEAQASTGDTPPTQFEPKAESAPAQDSKSESGDSGGEDRRSSQQGGGEDKGRNRGGRNRRGRQRNNNNEGRQQQPQAQQQPRHEAPIDAEELGKKAWHIYSTEVCEEGLRYIDETDANKLVRRSFRMAEIFMRYEQGQIQTVNQAAEPPKPSRPERSAEEATPASEETPAETEAAPEAPAAEAEAKAAESKEGDDEVIEPQTIDVD